MELDVLKQITQDVLQLAKQSDASSAAFVDRLRPKPIASLESDWP